MLRRDFEPAKIKPINREASRRRLFGAENGGPFRGVVQGLDIGGAVTVLAYGTDSIGDGPVLHVHPYDETFVVMEGNARFLVGDEVVIASAGDIVFGPAEVPHRFENLGPGRLQTIDVHHSPKWIQTDL